MTDEVSNLSGNGDLAMWLCDSGWVPRNDAQWTRIMPLWNEIAQLRAENARLVAELACEFDDNFVKEIEQFLGKTAVKDGK
jgi:hypothetical protein